MGVTATPEGGDARWEGNEMPLITNVDRFDCTQSVSCVIAGLIEHTLLC